MGRSKRKKTGPEIERNIKARDIKMLDVTQNIIHGFHLFLFIHFSFLEKEKKSLEVSKQLLKIFHIISISNS